MNIFGTSDRSNIISVAKGHQEDREKREVSKKRHTPERENSRKEVWKNEGGGRREQIKKREKLTDYSPEEIRERVRQASLKADKKKQIAQFEEKIKENKKEESGLEKDKGPKASTGEKIEHVEVGLRPPNWTNRPNDPATIDKLKNALSNQTINFSNRERKVLESVINDG